MHVNKTKFERNSPLKYYHITYIGKTKYMLWFNFILGLIFIFFCFKLIITNYHTQKQKKIIIKPRLKLNHNMYKLKRSIAQISNTLWLDEHKKLYYHEFVSRILTTTAKLLRFLDQKIVTFFRMYFFNPVQVVR